MRWVVCVNNGGKTHLFPGLTMDDWNQSGRKPSDYPFKCENRHCKPPIDFDSRQFTPGIRKSTPIFWRSKRAEFALKNGCRGGQMSRSSADFLRKPMTGQTPRSAKIWPPCQWKTHGMRKPLDMVLSSTWRSDIAPPWVLEISQGMTPHSHRPTPTNSVSLY